MKARLVCAVLMLLGATSARAEENRFVGIARDLALRDLYTEVCADGPTFALQIKADAQKLPMVSQEEACRVAEELRAEDRRYYERVERNAREEAEEADRRNRLRLKWIAGGGLAILAALIGALFSPAGRRLRSWCIARCQLNAAREGDKWSSTDRRSMALSVFLGAAGALLFHFFANEGGDLLLYLSRPAREGWLPMPFVGAAVGAAIFALYRLNRR